MTDIGRFRTTHIGQQNLDTASSAKERSDLCCGYEVSTVRTDRVSVRVNQIGFTVPTVRLLRFPSTERQFPVKSRSEGPCVYWIFH
jgi:hypothetical protein